MKSTVVAVLGCGVIGSSWIESFTSKGHRVQAWDPSPDALNSIRTRFKASVQIYDNPEIAVRDASFIQECGPEVIETKRDLLQRIAPCIGARSILASSTSTLQPTQLQQGSSFADRILIGHPFNPPHILPLVEVIGGVDTAQWAIDDAMRFYTELGKHPVCLRRERLGHLANRLQAALWREAVDAVASGQATVEDVDAAVTLALGPRWAVMGPFATFNLGGGAGGLAHFFQHLGLPFEALWDDARRPELTPQLKQQLVDAIAGIVGRKSSLELAAERDLRLRRVLVAAQAPLEDAAND